MSPPLACYYQIDTTVSPAVRTDLVHTASEACCCCGLVPSSPTRWASCLLCHDDHDGWMHHGHAGQTYGQVKLVEMTDVT